MREHRNICVAMRKVRWNGFGRKTWRRSNPVDKLPSFFVGFLSKIGKKVLIGVLDFLEKNDKMCIILINI